MMAQLAAAEALDRDLQNELKQYADSDPTLLKAQSMNLSAELNGRFYTAGRLGRISNLSGIELHRKILGCCQRCCQSLDRYAAMSIFHLQNKWP